MSLPSVRLYLDYVNDSFAVAGDQINFRKFCMEIMSQKLMPVCPEEFPGRFLCWMSKFQISASRSTPVTDGSTARTM